MVRAAARRGMAEFGNVRAGGSDSGRPRVGAVVLSQGDRPTELARCLTSLLDQRDVDLDLVCVGNGWSPAGLPAGVRTMHLPHNVGIPAARNVGARACAGVLLLFFDDDAWAPEKDSLRAMAAGLRDERIGAVQARIADADGVTLRRWVPRAHVGDPTRSGPAFTLLEGATMIRRTAFDGVGGWPDAFFYGHEGLDLAWRLWGGGWHLRYDADVVVRHPSTPVTRHAEFYRMNARNRVWLARRNLPWPLVPVYLGTWTAISLARFARRPAGMWTWLRGNVEGWRTPAGPRHPMRWRTVTRLARLGQPPII